MEFTFENHGTNTYLVYSVKSEDTVDTMSLGMLTHNKIPGLANTQFAQMDANKFIKYNISAKVSVRQFLEGIVNKARLMGVFRGIVSGLLSAEEYMIDTRSVQLDLDYMFVDVSSYQTALICLPLMNTEQQTVDFGMMFKSIIFQTQFDQSENCDYIAKLLNYLNRASQFSLVEFRDVLNEIEHGRPAANGFGAPPENKQMPGPVQSVRASTQPSVGAVSQTVGPTSTPAYTPQGANIPGNKQPLVYGGAPVAPQSTPVTAPAAAPVVPPRPSPMVPPNQKKAGKEKAQDIQPHQPQEKEISFFYLMQHYNKENAAAYKAQKEAKKANAKGNGRGEKKAKGKDKAAPMGGVGYAVPPQAARTPMGAMPQAARTPMGATPQPTASPMRPGVPTPTTMPTATAVPTAVTPGAAQPPVSPLPTAQTVQQPVVAPRPTQGPGEVQPPVQPRPGINFGETTVLVGGTAGETTVLSATSGAAPMVTPYLIRKKNNEKIPLNKPVFRVGKERSYVDYFIGDNTAISRSHANFITRDGQHLVVDTNSTNHTFVNGAMIQSNQEVQINHGDMIRLANEDFEFRLY